MRTFVGRPSAKAFHMQSSADDLNRLCWLL